MVDLNLTDIFLAGMTTYGPLTLGLAMLLGTMGIPAPLPILAVAAGAFARHGSINWGLAALLALAGATLGDSLGYAVGHWASEWVQRRYGDSPAWTKARARFLRNGDVAIYITRFLLTPLAVPTNLVAGVSSYPFRRFLAYTVAGTLTFIIIFGGMGFVFARQWEAVGAFVSNYFDWLVGASVVVVVVYFLARHLLGKRWHEAGHQSDSEPGR